MARTKRKKVLLFFISSFMLLIIVSVIIATVEISSPRLTNALSAKVENALGIPVTAGAMSIRLSGGLRIHDIALGEPGNELFTAKGIVLECNFLEMLKRSFTVNNLLIEEPIITIDGGNSTMFPFILPAYVEDDETGIRFRLSRVQIASGQVRTRGAGPETAAPLVIVDRFSVDARSAGRYEPVEIKAEAAVLKAITVSTSGKVSPGEDFHIDLSSTLEIDWENIGKPLAGLGLAPRFQLEGKGRTSFKIRTSGGADAIDIVFSGDATGQEISLGGFFSKPAGLKTLLAGNAVFSYPALLLKDAELKIGWSTSNLNGEIVPGEGSVKLRVSSDLKAEEIPGLIPALKDIELGGEAVLDMELTRRKPAPPEAAGTCRIRNWKLNYFAGDSLEFDFSLYGSQFNFKNISGKIGEGDLTGHGLITPGGEYHFSIEGLDIDLEKFLDIKQNDAPPFKMTGNARLSAGMGGRAGGFEYLSGRGNFSADSGFIQTMPWVENFLVMINMPELMPFEYKEIKTSFLIQDGVLKAQGQIDGKNAAIKTEKATLDFVKNRKLVQADFLLPPTIVERQRSKFREFDRFFYVDGAGYAHMSVVWDGPLAETMPNIAASLLQTSMKKLLSR